MMMMIVVDLPECILLLIKDYISNNDYRNLLNCLKLDYLQQLKKKTARYQLDVNHSKLYCDNKEFHEKILTLIEDPSKQIELNLFNFKAKIANCFDVYSVTLFQKKYQDFAILPAISKLIVLGSESDNWNELQSLVTLQLYSLKNLTSASGFSECRSLTNVLLKNCPRLTDINGLSHVSNITIVCCPMTNDGVLKLGKNLKQFALEENIYLSNVNHLLSLNKLTLHNIREIKNISGLRSLSHLSVARCPQFKYYSHLPSLKKITISLCDNFQFNDFDCSLQTKQIHMEALSNLDLQTGILKFKSLTILKIVFKDEYVGNEISLNCLASLSHLKSLHLTNLRDRHFNIQLFPRLVYFTLIRNNSFKGIYYPMSNLRILQLINCSQLKSIEGLATAAAAAAAAAGNSHNNHLHTQNHLQYLKIENCPEFIPDYSFYNILFNDVDVLVYDSVYNPAVKEVQKRLSTMEPLTRPIGHRRKKQLKIIGEMPFTGELLKSLFSTVRLLILELFTHLFDLASFIEVDIHQIPQLSISRGMQLRSLYPSEFVVQHEQVTLSTELKDYSNLVNVPCVFMNYIPDDLPPFKANAPSNIGGFEQEKYKNFRKRFQQSYRNDSQNIESYFSLLM